MTDTGASDLTRERWPVDRPGAWWSGIVRRIGHGLRQIPTALRSLRLSAVLRTLEAEQDRWFLWLPVLIGGGIGGYFVLLAEPSPAWACGGMFASFGLLLAARDNLAARLVARVVLAVALGFGAAQIRTFAVEAPVLTRQSGSIAVAGWIEELEPRGTGAYRVVIRAASIEGLDGERPFRVRIRIPGSATGLRIGDAIRLRARLSPPPLPALPGDYDFARRAYFQRIGGVGYSRTPPQAANDLGPPPWSLAVWAPGENMRRNVAERINTVLAGDHAAIANALIQGDQGAITDRTMTTMRDSGLAHILSISGLHMAIVAGALFWAIRAMLALSPAVTQLLPVRPMAAIAAGAGAFLYLMLSGWQVPAVRSFVMIAIMFLAIVLARPALSLRNVAMAALILLVAKPDNLLDVSFLMSFAATTGLVALYEEIGERRRGRTEMPEPAGPIRRFIHLIGADILTTLVAGLSVAPLGAYFFHVYQHYSVLGNLLALPIVSLWLMPLVLIVLIAMPVGLEAVPLYLMKYGIDALMLVATWVAAIPGAVSAIPAMPLSALILMMLGALWLAIWRRHWRWLGLVVIGVGCWKSPDRSPADILVGRDAEALAIRLADGRLSALANRRASYEIARWLEHDGDRRGVINAARGDGFRCDATGCWAQVKGLTLAFVPSPAALRDTCAKADIVVVRFPRARGCIEAKLVIDSTDLRKKGTHLIDIGDAGVPRLSTLADYRGMRPWTQTWADAKRSTPWRRDRSVTWRLDEVDQGRRAGTRSRKTPAAERDRAGGETDPW